MVVNEKIIELVRALVNTEKDIHWEPTPIENMYRAKIGKYYIEIEKYQDSIDKCENQYAVRIFTVNENYRTIITYKMNDDTQDKYLFPQLFVIAFSKANNSTTVIDEILAELNS